MVWYGMVWYGLFYSDSDVPIILWRDERLLPNRLLNVMGLWGGLENAACVIGSR
jgi:hypothetical protein